MATVSLAEFEESQPWVTRFFSQALQTQHLVNAYLCLGRDIPMMMRVAFRLAQIINCTGTRNALTEACGECQNCRWVADNQHPSVITLSNLTFPPKDKTPPHTGRIISANQISDLVGILARHSGGMRRVVILCGASEADDPPAMISQPNDWLGTKSKAFQPMSLDRKLFADAPANKFLKSLEEPPPDVLFFLLADSEEKLLETIVSRCQRVPFKTPSELFRPTVQPDVAMHLSRLLDPSLDWMSRTRFFSQIMADKEMDAPTLLSQCQQYVWQTLAQSHQGASVHPIYQQLRHLEQAKVMLKNKVREDAVLDHLFLQWAKPS